MKAPLLPYLLLCFLAIIALLSSCDDIIEPSINSAQVKLEAPGNKDTTTNYTINFWWDAVNHSLTYELQIVNGTFLSPANLVLDTVVTKNIFAFNLSPGSYQWRVMAQNGSSQTGFSNPYNLVIEPTSITQQSALLVSPANTFLTNQASLIFQWGSLYGATKYNFEVDTNNFATPSTVLFTTIIPGQQISYTFPKVGQYRWRVQAQNDTAQAQWSAVNTLTFNNIPPGQVTIATPANGVTIGQPVAMQWNGVANATHYKLYVLQSDSTTSFSPAFPLVTSGTTYSFNLGASGNQVYWKVSAIDAEGNEGPVSTLHNFYIQ
jgi:hypothetical protein